MPQAKGSLPKVSHGVVLGHVPPGGRNVIDFSVYLVQCRTPLIRAEPILLPKHEPRVVIAVPLVGMRAVLWKSGKEAPYRKFSMRLESLNAA
jgi:hypothetical protein